MSGMDHDDRDLLLFESEHPVNNRRKEALIRERFAISWVRYRQRLQRLIRTADAAVEFPALARSIAERTERAVAARANRRLWP
jgi:hypothetical protein